MNDLRVDLKVCEGCGALWLRVGGTVAVYCRGCSGRMAEFPAPRALHAGGPRTRMPARGCGSGRRRANGGLQLGHGMQVLAGGSR